MFKELLDLFTEINRDHGIDELALRIEKTILKSPAVHIALSISPDNVVDKTLLATMTVTSTFINGIIDEKIIIEKIKVLSASMEDYHK